VASLAFGVLEPLHLRVPGVLAAVPLQGQLLHRGQAQPAVLAPDLHVGVVALVEVVAARHRAEAAVVELQGDRGRVLDVDRLAGGAWTASRLTITICGSNRFRRSAGSLWTLLSLSPRALRAMSAVLPLGSARATASASSILARELK